MARQNVNIGATANDGSGDTLRVGATKINENFVELYNVLGGDSAAITDAISLADSGLVFNGVINNTVLTFNEGGDKIIATLPDSSGEVVITSATQTLTNKTLDSAYLNDVDINHFNLIDADGQHKYIFKPAEQPTDVNINIPILGDSDTFTFNNHEQTLTNKTLFTPRITGGELHDSVGNTLLGITRPGGTPANEITLSAAPSGSAPSVNASGANTNINLEINAKGTGAVLLDKIALNSKQISFGPDGDSDMSTNTLIFANVTSLLETVYLEDGSTNGELKYIVNRGTGNLRVRQDSATANFAFGKAIIVGPEGSVQLVYETFENEWHLVGNQVDSANSLIRIIE